MNCHFKWLHWFFFSRGLVVCAIGCVCIPNSWNRPHFNTYKLCWMLRLPHAVYNFFWNGHFIGGKASYGWEYPATFTASLVHIAIVSISSFHFFLFEYFLSMRYKWKSDIKVYRLSITSNVGKIVEYSVSYILAMQVFCWVHTHLF